MEYLYPGGLAKAITFSYDDGQVYDRRLIEIFNQAGFKGTFHLNSGNLDKDGYVQKAELPTLYAELRSKNRPNMADGLPEPEPEQPPTI